MKAVDKTSQNNDKSDAKESISQSSTVGYQSKFIGNNPFLAQSNSNPFVTAQLKSSSGNPFTTQNNSNPFATNTSNPFAVQDSSNISTDTAQNNTVIQLDENQSTEPEDMQYASTWDTNGIPASSSSPSGSVGADGNMSAGGSRTRSETVGIDNDTFMRNSSTTSGGVSFNPNNGQVGANAGYSRSTQIGDQTSTQGVNGSGYLEFNREGGLEGGGAALSASSNGTSVNIGGGIIVTATEPRLDTDGQYVITWRRQYTATAGGGHTGSRGAGGSASYQGERSITGSRKFATREAAQAFYRGRTWTSIDPSDAAALQEGDQISQTDSDRITGGGSLELSGVTVGASISVGSSRSVEVTGLGNSRISVKVLDTDILGGALTLGAPGVSISGGLESSNSSGYIVTFDLGTTAGQSAFSYLRTNGRLPSNNRGYTIEANIEGNQSQRTSGIGIAGVSANRTSTTSETNTTYASGRSVTERSGTSGMNVSVPFMGTHSQSDQITATRDSEQSNRTYDVTSSANSSSTQSVNQSLARSTGVGYNLVENSRSDQRSRQWQISSSFSQAQITQLVAEIRRGNWNYNALFNQSGSGSDFAEVVRNAGNDWDRIDSALSTFISETGDRGLELIRSTIRTTPQYSLTLQGDPYMTGEAGHTRLAGKIRGWERKLTSRTDVRTVGNEVTTELAQQRQRLSAIREVERYPDLPREIRAREITRTQRETTQLEGLQQRSLTMVREQNTSAESITPSNESSSTESSTPSRESSNPANQRIETAPSQPTTAQEWEVINRLEAQTITARNETIEVGNESRRAHWIHNGAYAQNRSAYETWGEEHWYGDGEHVAEYTLARSHISSGNSVWSASEAMYSTYQQDKTRIELMSPSEAQGRVRATLETRLNNAKTKYRGVKNSFQNALTIYDRIRAAHPDKRNNQFGGYARGQTLPSELRLE